MNNGKANFKETAYFTDADMDSGSSRFDSRITVEFSPSESMKTFVSIIKLGFVPTMAPLRIDFLLPDNKIRQKKRSWALLRSRGFEMAANPDCRVCVFHDGSISFCILAVVFCDK